MDKQTPLLAREFSAKPEHIENIITLLDEGNTVPFLARYRKELHGTMDDQRIREVADRLKYLRNLDKRREEVCAAIEGQGKLTAEAPHTGDRGSREGAGAPCRPALCAGAEAGELGGSSWRLCKPRKGRRE